MIIRSIKPEDNRQIKSLIQESLESHGLATPGTAYFDPQLNDLYQYYADLKDANYWVVEQEGTVVGGVGIAPFLEQGNVCELQKLYVSANAQGRGLGKQLIEIALTFASQHYQKCYLETMLELKTARFLYEKYGFVLLAEPLVGSKHSAMNAWYIKNLTFESTGF